MTEWLIAVSQSTFWICPVRSEKSWADSLPPKQGQHGGQNMGWCKRTRRETCSQSLDCQGLSEAALPARAGSRAVQARERVVEENLLMKRRKGV